MRYHFWLGLITAITIFTNAQAQAIAVLPYTGPINCKTLEQDLAYVSPLLIGRFCRNAVDACDAQNMLNGLNKASQLGFKATHRLQNYINTQLELCELAFASHAPEFYEKRVLNADQSKGLSTTFDHQEPITPTYIE